MVYDSTKEEEIVYRLVTSEESDVAKGLISTTSPIGRGIVGKKVGDMATIVTPNGKRELEILKLTTVHDEAARRRRRRGRYRHREVREVRMTWTSAFGRACGWLLDRIVHGLALTRISPNALTFIGLVINIVAAFFFGHANATNAGIMFFYAGMVIFGAGIFDMVDGRVARREQPGHGLRIIF